MKRLSIPGHGEVEVAVSRGAGPDEWIVHLDGQEHRVGWDGERLRVGGRLVPVFYHRDGRELEWMLRGRRYSASEAAASRGAAAPVAFNGEVRSAMPGTILKLRVAPGQEVEAGEPLVVMESMKMEMTVEAPADGTVSQVSVTEGELVAMGQLLVKLAVD